MNRKARRAAFKLGNTFTPLVAGEPAQYDQLLTQARQAQASGHHSSAIRYFAKAIDAAPNVAESHYHLAVSSQALGRWDKAVAHFTRALELEPDGALAERAVMQIPTIAGALHRTARTWPKPLSAEELFGSPGVVAIAGEAFLHCVLKTIWLCNVPLEILLTRVRALLLQDAINRTPEFAGADRKSTDFFVAIAQQCFINEYVYAQSDLEARQATELRELLCDKLKAGANIPPLLLAAVAAYFPLHTLTNAQALLQTDGKALPGDLLRQQVRDPFEERQDRANIPVLTPIDDRVTMDVRQQYEESPYPRWSIIPPHKLQKPGAVTSGDPADILIAGCGTGKHSIDAALLFPQARVLAVDISLASLAYARRKGRAAGLTAIEYAQADILRLGSLDRRFDRIESIGVLHHLGDPKAGLRILASLSRPGGVIEIALYSEIARRAIVAGRARIAERGYPPTPVGIRACRQDILRAGDGSLEKSLATMRDFYSTSGCRDLLFNVMEHRFNLAEIKALLSELDLSLVEFEVEPKVLAQFRAEFPGADASDLNRWHAFEMVHPDTFIGMYRFLVRPGRLARR